MLILSLSEKRKTMTQEPGPGPGVRTGTRSQDRDQETRPGPGDRNQEPGPGPGARTGNRRPEPGARTGTRSPDRDQEPGPGASLGILLLTDRGPLDGDLLTCRSGTERLLKPERIFRLRRKIRGGVYRVITHQHESERTPPPIRGHGGPSESCPSCLQTKAGGRTWWVRKRERTSFRNAKLDPTG